MKASLIRLFALGFVCCAAAVAASAQAPAILVVPQNPDPTQQSLTINFHNQLKSTRSAAQTVTLWNISSQTISGITASVTSGEPFAIVSAVSPTSLNPGQSATLKVAFFGQATGGPSFTSTLTFGASTTGIIPIPSVTLTGTTVSPNSAAVSANPAYTFYGLAQLNGNTNNDAVYFGNQSSGVTTCAQKIFLSNGGSASTTVSSVSGLTGTAFTVTNFTSGMPVPVGVNTASIGVTYSPSGNTDSATLTITLGNGGTQSLSLYGSSINTTPTASNEIPLIDMGNTRTYVPTGSSSSFTGGLFDGNFGPTVDTGCNSPSFYITTSNPAGASQDTIGRAFAALIQPIDGTTGLYDGTGNAVLLSLGMSNASDEWCGVGTDMGNDGDDNLCGSPTYSGKPPSAYSFMQEAAKQTGLNSSLVIVNGAISSQEACDYTLWSATQTLPPYCTAIPTGVNGAARVDYDAILTDQLSPHVPELYENQVQAIWLKEADVLIVQESGQSGIGSLGCTGCIPDPYNLETNFGNIVRATKHRYPNLRIIFLTSRSYGGFTNFKPTHEPYAYEGGFANKWLVKAQIDQMNNGGCVVDTDAEDLNYLYTPASNCTASAAPEAVWVIWDRLPSTESLAGSTYIWAFTPGENEDIYPNSNNTIWPYNGQNPSTCTPPETNSYFRDGQHPNDCGINQVGGTLLLNYFLTSPYTNPWFSAH